MHMSLNQKDGLITMVSFIQRTPSNLQPFRERAIAAFKNGATPILVATMLLQEG
ncbi:hypothetical protein R6Q57_024971 [Mikania cordata]